MKEKIIAALKTTYASMGLGDKALDGVASFLEKTVTSEDDIANVVAGDNVKVLIKGFQSDTDRLRNQNVELTKKLAELGQKPQPTKDKSEGDSNDDKLTELLTLIKSRQEEVRSLKEKSLAMEKKERNTKILSDLEKKLKSGGSDNAAILKLTLKSVEIGDNDTVDSLVESVKKTYDDNFKEFYGDGVIPPSGHHHAEGYKKGDFAGMAKSLGLTSDNS